MVSAAAPLNSMRSHPALRLLPGVIVTAGMSSSASSMDGASGSPQMALGSEVPDSGLQPALLCALTVAVTRVPSEMLSLLKMKDSLVVVFPVSLVCNTPTPLTVTM